MQIRRATKSDAKALTRVYLSCSDKLGESFVLRLGRRFLDRYHSLMVREENSLALLAEDEDGTAVGIAYGSLDAAEHLSSLRRHKFSLLLASLGAIVKNPTLVADLMQRNRSSTTRDEKFVVSSGARVEFWGWDPNRRDAAGALELLQRWLAEAWGRGAGDIRSEVDDEHENVLRIHKALGAKVERTFATPDGRRRRIIVYEKKMKSSGGGASSGQVRARVEQK